LLWLSLPALFYCLQDITFFDTQASTGGLLQGLNEDSLAVKEAISEKVFALFGVLVLPYHVFIV
jgi:hypothetical protein